MDRDSCTGATNEGEVLAAFRLLKPGGIEYYARHMTAAELSERRMYLRKTLAPYPRWENLSNEQLEDIRLRRIDEGYIVEDAEGREFFLPSKRVAEREAEFRRIRSMVPFEFWNLRAAAFDWTRYRSDTTELKELVNDFLLKYEQFRAKGMGLYICSGTKGSGKTMLACCLLNEITRRYKGSVKFVNILDFLEMTKKGFNGEDVEVQAIHQASLLIVDDIGVQMAKEWIDTVLYSLINHRYVNRLPTIYTSNVPVEALKMDDRIIDRIGSTTYLAKLPEESIRKAVREQEKQKILSEIKNTPR